MASKGAAIGGAAAATTVAVGVGVGATQFSSENPETKTTIPGGISVKLKPPTNRKKLVNFQFKNEDNCNSWLEQEFTEVNEKYKQKVVDCVQSKKLPDIAGYFGLKPADFSSNPHISIAEKWKSQKQSVLIKIFGSPEALIEEESSAQAGAYFIKYCEEKNKQTIDANFTDDNWTDYLTACIKEDEKFGKAIGKKFWINENKETSN